MSRCAVRMHPEVIHMKEIRCNTCAYYRQHYTLSETKLLRIYCGHCTLRKANSLRRNKKPNAPACDQYIACSSSTEAFVSQEYLSKALLDYALSLPLLPTIEDESRRG